MLSIHRIQMPSSKCISGVRCDVQIVAAMLKYPLTVKKASSPETERRDLRVFL